MHTLFPQTKTIEARTVEHMTGQIWSTEKAGVGFL